MVTQAHTALEHIGDTALLWGARSASTLDKVKTQYAYYTRNRNKTDDTPLHFSDARISPDPSIIYLGVALNKELRWCQQGDRATKCTQAALDGSKLPSLHDMGGTISPFPLPNHVMHILMVGLCCHRVALFRTPHSHYSKARQSLTHGPTHCPRSLLHNPNPSPII
jgi:hypothetical protein